VAREVFTHAHAVISGYVPIVCLVVFNSGISIAVLRSRKESKRLSHSGRSDSSTEMSITKVSVSVTMFFVLTSLPIRFIGVLIDNGMVFRNSPGLSDSDILQIKRFSNNFCITVENLNYCFNFYMYSMTSRRFRKELWDIITCTYPGSSKAQW
jgi:hypothetical protein